jgi:sugar O-acyltransferase (sialic acid O-acetyltransferase NeuD family)
MSGRSRVPLRAVRMVASGPGARLVIVGADERAAVAFEHFRHDSPYEVVAFSAEAGRASTGGYCGLPLVPLSFLTRTYPPGEYLAFVAVPPSPTSQARRRLYAAVKAAGYTCVSYISSRAFAVPSAHVGENTFVHERAALQHGVRIGDNAIVGSGTCVGHSAVVADDCIVGQRVALAGHCKIGRGCFLGASSCVDSAVSVADHCVLRPGTVVLKDTKPHLVYTGNPARPEDRA